jgi:type I restriction enzyme S subunit
MNNNKNKLVPDLRFPEFINDGEWDLEEFSNFIKLDRGSSPRPIQDYLTQDESGVNWIKIGDTKNAVNSIIYEVEEKITKSGAKKSRKVEKGELILANSMSFGKTYELALEGCIYDGWFVLRKYEKHFHKPFLLQLLNSDFMQNQYKKLSAGGIVQNISSDIVYSSKLYRTSLNEQQKIASCLSSLDEVIAAHTQKLEALKEHRKGLMQNLFPQEGETGPKRRFPEFSKSGKWSNEKLGDLTTKVGSGVTPLGGETKYKKNGRPFVRSQNVGWGILLLKDIAFIDEKTHLESIGTEIELDDVLLNITGASIGRSAVASEQVVGGNVNQHVCIIRTIKGSLNSNFLCQYLISSLGQKQIDSYQAGGNRQGLNFVQIRSLTLPIPPSLDEQRKISECLSSLNDKISAQNLRVEQLKLHKSGLLQGLFPKIKR